MFRFSFTCKVICADGELRRIKHSGFYASRDLLRTMLKEWSGSPGPNGGTYEYFESAIDLSQNDSRRKLPNNYHFPSGALLRTSVHAWHNEMVDYTYIGDRYTAYAQRNPYKPGYAN
jgi:hypothetical protein